VVPPLDADAFAAGIKSASKVLIANAGHFPHLENVEETLKAIGTFIGAKVPETA
jgi:pimeloyl-ACP methyl ester carboxylesterase